MTFAAAAAAAAAATGGAMEKKKKKKGRTKGDAIPLSLSRSSLPPSLPPTDNIAARFVPP